MVHSDLASILSILVRPCLSVQVPQLMFRAPLQRVVQPDSDGQGRGRASRSRSARRDPHLNDSWHRETMLSASLWEYSKYPALAAFPPYLAKHPNSSGYGNGANSRAPVEQVNDGCSLP